MPAELSITIRTRYERNNNPAEVAPCAICGDLIFRTVWEPVIEMLVRGQWKRIGQTEDMSSYHLCDGCGNEVMSEWEEE